MARLLRLDEIIENYSPEWHPLDGISAPEYVPPHWDGPHVGKRLVEAFRTLSRMPVPRGPRDDNGGFWPEWVRDEWIDLMADVEQDAAQAEAQARVANRVRIRPTAAEVSRMEEAIAWPARYLRLRPHLARIVGIVAMWRSRERDLEWIARRLRQHQKIVRTRNCAALDEIAAGLRRENIPTT